MARNSDTLAAIKTALEVSPDNIPLRRHYAELLFNAGQVNEAETEFRAVLARDLENIEARLGLSEIYLEQGKLSLAMVLVEDVLKSKSPPSSVHVLHAWLLVRLGEVDAARDAYRRGIELDASLEDDELSEMLRPAEQNPAPPQSRFSFSTEQGPVATSDDPEFNLSRSASELDKAMSFLEKAECTFSNVGGMDNVKDEIRMKIILPMKNHDLYAAYGKKAGGGILLYGPPGCGKTHLARATAGEISASFMSVGLHDILDMYIGNSEKRLHAMFEEARRSRPCVLFIDEVDALGANRTDMRQSAGRHLINQFLNELDGVDTNNEGVLILAATNAPWHLDPAFRRTGRFDRIIFVPPPDLPARDAILRLMLKDRPCGKIDFSNVARKAEGFSGADLKGIVDLAVEAKLREAMQTGVPQPITDKELLAALKQVYPSTKEWFATARNYALFSNEGGLYDDILHYLKIKPR